METDNGGEYEVIRRSTDLELAERCLRLCDNPTGFVDALDEEEQVITPKQKNVWQALSWD